MQLRQSEVFKVETLLNNAFNNNPFKYWFEVQQTSSLNVLFKQGRSNFKFK